METSLIDATGMPGAGLTGARSGKVLSDRPTLEPAPGNLAVRELRPVKTGVFSRRQTCQGKGQKSGAL
jgi:hypothetical protein